jgi:hypothetical protein
MRLRIEVDHQRIGSAPGKQRTQIERGGRLADPPFLIENRHFRHRVSYPINGLQRRLAVDRLARASVAPAPPASG